MPAHTLRRMSRPMPTLAHAASACLAAGLLACAGVASGQSMQQENVRIEYGQVLRAEPVYETRHETWLEQQCEDGNKRLLSRIAGAVKDVLKPDKNKPDDGCREVPVEREFRRLVGYDVDYTYKGSRYRSRMQDDPGNRVKLRVSVMPYPGN